MNWDAIGAVSDLIASLAVLASLIYLAIQVRHGIATSKATAYQEIYRDLRASVQQGTSSEIIPKLFRGEKLTSAELSELPKILLLNMRAYENWWVQHRDGILSDEIFEAYISHLTITMRSRIAQKWWLEKRPKFVPGFEIYVNQIIRGFA